jgi:hypothetical protein
VTALYSLGAEHFSPSIEAAVKLAGVSQPSKALSERRHHLGIRANLGRGLRLGKLGDIYFTRRDLNDNQSGLQ